MWVTTRLHADGARFENYRANPHPAKLESGVPTQLGADNILATVINPMVSTGIACIWSW